MGGSGKDGVIVRRGLLACKEAEEDTAGSSLPGLALLVVKGRPMLLQHTGLRHAFCSATLCYSTLLHLEVHCAWTFQLLPHPTPLWGIGHLFPMSTPPADASFPHITLHAPAPQAPSLALMFWTSTQSRPTCWR